MVVGLPVILLSEPYVNCWINFTKIKPILDQFQGCYRDKCQWFAPTKSTGDSYHNDHQFCPLLHCAVFVNITVRNYCLVASSCSAL